MATDVECVLGGGEPHLMVTDPPYGVEYDAGWWAIDRLIPYAKNARTHTDAQVAAIAASIKEWGWTTPALVGEDGGLSARRPAARHRPSGGRSTG